MPIVAVCRCGASFCINGGRFEDHANPFTRQPCEGSGKPPQAKDAEPPRRRGRPRLGTAKRVRVVAFVSSATADALARQAEAEGVTAGALAGRILDGSI